MSQSLSAYPTPTVKLYFTSLLLKYQHGHTPGSILQGQGSILQGSILVICH